jgi:hypothetical protein
MEGFNNLPSSTRFTETETKDAGDNPAPLTYTEIASKHLGQQAHTGSDRHLTPDLLKYELAREQITKDKSGNPAYVIPDGYADSAKRQIAEAKPEDLKTIEEFSKALHNADTAQMDKILERFKCNPQHLDNLTMVFDLGLNVRGFDSKYDWDYSYSDDGVSSIKITSKPDSKTPFNYTFTTEPSCGHGA